MKFKEYYFYKKNFVRKSEKSPSLQKSKGVLLVKSTLNNVFVNVLDLNGKLLSRSTSGLLGCKSTRSRVSSQAYEDLFKKVTKEIKARGWEEIIVLFSGVKRNSFRWLRYLSQGGIKVGLVKDLTRLPYNGCRLKKERRG